MSSPMMNQREQENKFYDDLFVRSGTWSTPTPNNDEWMRWEKIKQFLPQILSGLKRPHGQPIRILDVGCGRGWLTNLLSEYGLCEGIEPVATVVEYGRTLFPRLTLHVGFPKDLLTGENFQPYDLIVTSEVIEHIPDSEKSEFVHTLQQLLSPDGVVILTTPRREVWEQWHRVSTPNQPIEDWITESDLLSLFRHSGFSQLGLERIYFDLEKFHYTEVQSGGQSSPSSAIIPLYQVWAFGTAGYCQKLSCKETRLQDNGGASQDVRSPCTPISTITTPTPTSGLAPNSSPRSGHPEKPLVSVIVPTLNRPETLRAALRSILQQTFTDYEIIVVNDGGKDVGSLVDSFNQHKNINYVRHGRNRGLAAARNSGIGVARGKYIAYLDDDDRFGPRHLEILVKQLEGSSYHVAYTDAWRVWQTNEDGIMKEVKKDLPYSQDFNPDLLLLSNYFPVLCMMHEKECLALTEGGFDETLTTHEDWDLWIRLSRHYPFAHIKEITAEFTWRMDGTSMSSEMPEDFLRTKTRIYQKYDAHFQARPHLIPLREQELDDLRQRLRKSEFDCSIVIPVFNRVDLTQQCLTHLVQTVKDRSYEVILVDNASTDGTSDFLRTLRGDVQVVTNPENFGFAKACNQGAAAAQGKYVLFLNNDTVPQPGWLDPLIHEMEADSQVAVVGSKLLFPNGKVQHAGVMFSRTYGEPYHLFGNCASDLPSINRRREMQAVTAACMLVRKDSFKRIGGFDEGFINGFEDVDFCLRIRESGQKVIYQPKSLLYHLTSQTPGRKTHDKANAQRLRKKWEGQWTEDEDVVAFREGYVIQQSLSGQHLETSLYFRDDVRHSALWGHVAELQSFLLGQKKGPLADLQHNHEISALLQDVQAWPDDIGILEWVGRVCETVGCLTEAQRFWEKLLTFADHPSARLGLARLALQEHDLERATVHLDVLKARFPNDKEGWVVQGIFCMQQLQYIEAQRAFARVLSLDPSHRKAQMGMSLALMALNDWSPAWDLGESLVLEFPDDRESLKCLIQAGTALKAWEKLGSHLSRYVDRNPTDSEMRFALAGVLLRGAHLSQAQYHYAVLVTLQPDFDGLRDLEARLAEASVPSYALVK